MPEQIAEVLVEDLFYSILSPLPRSQRDLNGGVIAKLEENDTINKDRNDCWSAFSVDPREHSENEPEAFHGLTHIWESVISAAKEVDVSLEQTFRLVISGVSRSSSHLSDGLNADSGHVDRSTVSSPQATLEQVDQTDASTNVAPRKVVTYSRHPRYHYPGFVFEQCATTIYDERNLGNVLSALREVTIALWILCLAGWVHRDISGGNVYWFADTNMGLLGDFEYAIRKSEESDHDVRTGTPFFMAAETMSLDYIYTFPEGVPEKREVSFTPQRRAVTPAPVISEPELAFSYNPLHDLESIWWILVYVLFNNIESARSPDPDSRQTMMNELFHGRLESTWRQRFLRTMMRGHIDTVQECFHPSLAPLLELLVPLASILNSAYIYSEKTHPDKIDDRYFEIHGTFTEQLGENTEALSKIRLTL
ncbi:hypothetical protein C8R42DRAFT_125725 [Lentinula raphanica]|nr:hypothetical protein C8R42DRAFT_125725 [Lentinula raphanica]